MDFNKDIQYRIEDYLNRVANIAIMNRIRSTVPPEDLEAELAKLVVKVTFLESVHDEGDPQDYISNNDTCWNHLTYRLTTNVLGSMQDFDGTIDLPYMLNGGMFIVDGKPRIATNILSKNYDCSYNPDNHTFQLNNTKYIIQVNNKTGLFNGAITCEFHNQDGSHSTKIVRTQSELESLGTDLTIDKEQKQIISYLLDLDFDHKDQLVDKVDFNFLKALPFVPGINTKRDSVANLKIDGINESLMKYLNEWGKGSKGPKARIVSDIRLGLFPKTDKSPIFLVGGMMTFIMRFFRTAATSGIDIATVVNPLVFDQLHNKLKMPNFIPYTHQYRDLIDAPQTPENGNVNVINELNVCIYHNDTEGIGIHCYAYPYGTPVDIRYNEYINEYVLRSDEWDYDKNKLKDPYKGKFRVKYHTYTVEIDSNEMGKVKFIEPKEDDRFSITSRAIPFLNSSDSVRIAMGGGMLKQSIELEEPEDPLISSGNTEIDSNNSTLSTYASEDGIVTEVDGEVGVRYTSGVFQPFPRAMSGMNHVVLSQDRLVNPGDRVKKGQRLTTATTANNGYKTGKNANVFYLNYYGYTYEDGVVVSKSFAEKLAHWTVHDVVVNIFLGDVVRSLAKLGTKVDSDDVLYESINNPMTISGKETKHGSGDVANYITNITRVPNNIFGGVIIASKYEFNTEWGKSNKVVRDETNSDVINDFVASLSNLSDEAKKNIESVPQRYKNQALGRTSKWIGQNKYGQSIIGVVRYKIAVRRPLIVGDKLCNRYGSKGMVSLILPDDCRPYYFDQDGNKQYADIVANPASIISRKNSSQLNEALLSRCIDKIIDMCNKAKNDDELTEVLGLVKNIYGAQHKDLDLEGLKAMMESGRTAFKINVGTFRENSYDYVMDIVKKLGVAETEEVYVPAVSIHENKNYTREGMMNGIEVRCIEDENGDIDSSLEFTDGTTWYGGWLDNPLVVGVNYYEKLYHSAVWSGAVTPTRPNVNVPILGRGKIRAQGQAIGEMETWALQATGASELFQDSVRVPGYETSQYELLNAFLRGGFELNY